jgi:heat shock protein HslJ
MKAMALVVLIFAVGAVGCDDNPISPSEIANITWQLQSVSRVGSATVNVPNPDQFTVRFDTNNTVAVRADCNSCTGGYTIDGSSLSIGQLACTLVACPSPGLDALYTAALQNVRTAEVSGSELVLSGSEFTLRFRN